jgi:hypothetical protein
MKFEIKNRWSGNVQFTAEIEANETTSIWIKIGLAVKWAISNSANLSGANLSGADLSGANLRSADLRSADLSGANLSGANLSGANLRSANLRSADLRSADLRSADLRRADLRCADLSGADLSGADLRSADLTPIRDDFWAVLSSCPAEVPGLIAAITEGRVDGSTYTGDCSCLVGTLAHVRGCDVDALVSLAPDANRPAERFFLAINKGDTPETNEFSKIAHGWASDWLDRMRAAFDPSYDPGPVV